LRGADDRRQIRIVGLIAAVGRMMEAYGRKRLPSDTNVLEKIPASFNGN
jgi:hypothetical protein